MVSRFTFHKLATTKEAHVILCTGKLQADKCTAPEFIAAKQSTTVILLPVVSLQLQITNNSYDSIKHITI